MSAEPQKLEFYMFTYGTLKTGQPNHRHLQDTENGHAEFVGRGHTSQSYPLVIAGKYNIPYLLYVQGKGHHVKGEVYKIDSKKRDFLDDFESHPTYYERMEDDIVLECGETSPETRTVKCWIYFMKNYKPSMLDLDPIPEYDSYGRPGMQYVESEETEDLSDI